MTLLKDIPYKRIDTQLVKKEFLELLSVFEQAENAPAQKDALEKLNQLRTEVDNAFSLAHIRHSINTEDEFYAAEKDFYDDFGPDYGALEFKLNKSLLKSPFRETLAEQFGKQFFDLAETKVKTFSDEIIPELKQENRLKTQYEKLLASAKIPFDGKELNLSQIVPYETSIDRDTRKKASTAKFGFFESNAAKFDEIYDELVKVRQKIAQKLGFKNFVEVGYLRMGRTDYDAAMVKTYRDEVYQHIVPVYSWIKSQQSKTLNVPDMKFYDEQLYFQDGNPKPKGEPEWIMDQAEQMYQELSDETAEFFSFMMKNGLFDVLSRKGKSPGGYCSYLPKQKYPFIFANFNGTSGDIDVMTHEAGHAFQCYKSRHLEVPEYIFPTAEAAEIHSMSMEYFTWPYMELFFKEDTNKYKFLHLCQSLSFLPYGIAVDEFQHGIYENPDMTPDERKMLWKKMEAKYLPGRNYDGIEYLEKGGFWQRQAHIYEMPFYYIDYTLAGACALQFWVRDLEDHDAAWKDYLNLCKKGGSKPFLQLVETAGLKSPFEPGSLKTVADKAVDWLKAHTPKPIKLE